MTLTPDNADGHADRDTFLARIAASLGRAPDSHPGVPEPPPLPQALFRQVGPSDLQRVERFIERATHGSMVVQRLADDAGAVRQALAAALALHGAQRVLLNAGDMEARYALAADLQSHGLECVSWGPPTPDPRAAAFDCDAAITDARAGLADAGSLLVWSDPAFGRSSTLVTPLHIVLLAASRIVPDLIDGLALVWRECDGQMPSNVVLINGPSKTRDIEMHLVTGVHGPKHVHLLVIDGL